MSIECLDRAAGGQVRVSEHHRPCFCFSVRLSRLSPAPGSGDMGRVEGLGRLDRSGSTNSMGPEEKHTHTQRPAIELWCHTECIVIEQWWHTECIVTELCHTECLVTEQWCHSEHIVTEQWRHTERTVTEQSHVVFSYRQGVTLSV